MTEIPLFRELREAKRVLVTGCGGGFDIYSGVPIALALRALGKEVVLANLTFAMPKEADGADVLDDVLTRIDATMGNARHPPRAASGARAHPVARTGRHLHRRRLPPVRRRHLADVAHARCPGPGGG